MRNANGTNDSRCYCMSTELQNDSAARWDQNATSRRHFIAVRTPSMSSSSSTGAISLRSLVMDIVSFIILSYCITTTTLIIILLILINWSCLSSSKDTRMTSSARWRRWNNCRLWTTSISSASARLRLEVNQQHQQIMIGLQIALIISDTPPWIK